jgi:hypothetical protein
VTVTVAVLVTVVVPIVEVREIVVLPTLIAVTNPLEVTVAMAALAEDQVELTVPAAGENTAEFWL